jgi:hypothetical protein
LHKARAARAALEQSEADYRTTTLSAFQNVADSLAALQADADAVAATSRAADSAEATLRIVRLQVSLGQVAYLSILNAQQTALQAELSLVQAKASRLADTAALFQALGGGWWHRDDAHVRDLRGNDPLAIVGIHWNTQERSSFLKKRTKRLLFLRWRQDPGHGLPTWRRRRR